MRTPFRAIVKDLPFLDEDIRGREVVVEDKDIDINTLTELYIFKHGNVTYRLASEYLQVECTGSSFEDKVKHVTGSITELLLSKNAKYGNSALEPVRVFSKASPREQLLVRLDDKLSRLKTQHIDEDEDVLDDLLGYLILLKIAFMEEKHARN